MTYQFYAFAKVRQSEKWIICLPTGSRFLTETFIHDAPQLFDITLGDKETIHTTWNHPFRRFNGEQVGHEIVSQIGGITSAIRLLGKRRKMGNLKRKRLIKVERR